VRGSNAPLLKLIIHAFTTVGAESPSTADRHGSAPRLQYGDAIEVEVVGNGIAKDQRGPFTAYCVRIRKYSADGVNEWFVYKRYSQFRDLKYYLRLHKSVEVPCEFPGKRVWNIFEKQFLT